MRPEDVGGVHIKYLHHCHRQLWLYGRGVRPERLSESVQRGEAVHEITYGRYREVDLGAARLDHLDGEDWVHEIKSSRRPTRADRAQALHYCHQLHRVGVAARGAVLHYPATRRTVRIPYEAEQAVEAQQEIQRVVDVLQQPTAPPRLERSRCKGCSFTDYCWAD